MRELMLILHFVGLAMGIGTSFAFFFLGISGSKLGQDERVKFALNTFALSRMGHIGLTLLILSGGYLMTPYWAVLGSQPLLVAKLILVVTLVLCIVLLSLATSRVKKGDMSGFKKIAGLGRLALLIGLSIVVLAVLVFR
jgi:hypothetical protein